MASLQILVPISLHKSENNSGSGLQMRAILPSLKISTPNAVLRFDGVVGRRPTTSPLLLLLLSPMTPLHKRPLWLWSLDSHIKSKIVNHIFYKSELNFFLR